MKMRFWQLHLRCEALCHFAWWHSLTFCSAGLQTDGVLTFSSVATSVAVPHMAMTPVSSAAPGPQWH